MAIPKNNVFNQISNNIRKNKIQKYHIKLMYTWIICSQNGLFLKNKKNHMFVFYNAIVNSTVSIIL
jgi:hypothetical protein